MNSNPNQV